MALSFIRALMPQEEHFVQRFSRHAQCMISASQALKGMMLSTPENRPEQVRAIKDFESQGDTITRETIVALHRAFITPFDRSDIHALISAQDDALDLLEELVYRAALYHVTEFGPHMLKLAEHIEACAVLLGDCIPLLADVNRNAERIGTLCQQVGRIESEADAVLNLALSDLIAENPTSITVFIGHKEIYELLEAVTDRCDDVADLIEGIVLDNA